MQDGQRISTIDLFTRGLTLITRNAGSIAAAKAAADSTDLSIVTVHVGSDVRFPSDAEFEAMFGVSTDGANLVRPNAIVAWQSTDLPPDLERILDLVIAQITALPA